jgi:hypothetical protein
MVKKARHGREQKRSGKPHEWSQHTALIGHRQGMSGNGAI